MREFLAEQATMVHVRAAIESDEGWARDTWRAFAGELGFVALAIPEDLGGAGLGVRALALTAEELGATLAPIPWFETAVLSTNVLMECGARKLLARIATGESVATLAWRDKSGRPGEIGSVLRDGQLRGAVHYVPFGHVADFLVVAARTGNGVALCAVDAKARGVAIARDTTLDLTRPFSHITLDNVEAELLVVDGDVALQRAFATAGVVLAAEQIGAMARVLEQTLAYAKTRVQFGRVIGSFQSMKHRLADMALELEAARSALAWALDAIGTEAPDYPVACSGARAACSEAFLKIAAEGIQLIGGIGFTWEHSAHLYFKRARASSTLLESPAHHREMVARTILDTASI